MLHSKGSALPTPRAAGHWAAFWSAGQESRLDSHASVPPLSRPLRMNNATEQQIIAAQGVRYRRQAQQESLWMFNLLTAGLVVY